ncbi:hypothetical protein RFI_25453, partial [Reticulomyxa filosa]
IEYWSNVKLCLYENGYFRYLEIYCSLFSKLLIIVSTDRDHQLLWPQYIVLVCFYFKTKQKLYKLKLTKKKEKKRVGNMCYLVRQLKHFFKTFFYTSFVCVFVGLKENSFEKVVNDNWSDLVLPYTFARTCDVEKSDAEIHRLKYDLFWNSSNH